MNLYFLAVIVASVAWYGCNEFKCFAPKPPTAAELLIEQELAKKAEENRKKIEAVLKELEERGVTRASLKEFFRSELADDYRNDVEPEQEDRDGYRGR